MSATLRKIDLPAPSALHQHRVTGDFLDCYSVASNLPPRDAAEIITDFPGWAKGLLILRGALTAPFGLSADGPEAADKLGPFPLQSETDTEVIAGFDDKHLNFLVSVLSHEGHVSLATWVAPHNIGGRIYLAAIMPFHIAIARNALARVARA
ncbi:DUF2867 domain-containing protein [Loktanella sp. Alg231-35]|uniref:DUF2867 domain-containing protein n=1 Tax=Loktanella sp. Alg231-35 TaxID=1922220 RepID=UPI000D555FC3|nr:DUF2867 domain-containing protein [Loktanella sp. Alg231-35]